MKKIMLLLGFVMAVVIAYPTEKKEVKETLSKIELTEISTYAIKMDVVDYLNYARLEAGVTEVSIRYDLASSAQKWCEKLPQDFDHDKTKSTGNFNGEAILMYQGDINPEKIVRDFLNSPTHKSIILNGNYKNIGVGIKIVGKDNFVVVRFS